MTMNLADDIKYMPKWRIEKYADDAAFAAGQSYEVSEFEGNLLLNEGIAELLDIINGAGSTSLITTANARLGVGDDSTAASASHTDLIAASNKTFKAMASTYPLRSGQTI